MTQFKKTELKKSKLSSDFLSNIHFNKINLLMKLCPCNKYKK